MKISESREIFLNDTASLSKAIKPTSEMMARISGSFAQMAADHLGGQVSVALPLGFKVVREPRK